MDSQENDIKEVNREDRNDRIENEWEKYGIKR